jgi:hypothetical protein
MSQKSPEKFGVVESVAESVVTFFISFSLAYSICPEFLMLWSRV